MSCELFLCSLHISSADKGLDVYAYFSCQDDETVILIRAPVNSNACMLSAHYVLTVSCIVADAAWQTSVLETFATKIRYQMILDEAEARARLESGDTELNSVGIRKIKGTFISEDKR